jgi:hypothetical protein
MESKGLHRSIIGEPPLLLHTKADYHTPKEEDKEGHICRGGYKCTGSVVIPSKVALLTALREVLLAIPLCPLCQAAYPLDIGIRDYKGLIA